MVPLIQVIQVPFIGMGTLCTIDLEDNMGI